MHELTLSSVLLRSLLMNDSCLCKYTSGSRVAVVAVVASPYNLIRMVT